MEMFENYKELVTINDLCQIHGISKNTALELISNNEIKTKETIKMANQINKLSIDERFKEIKGFPKYYISNYGRVYSFKTNKFLKPQKHGKEVNGNSHKHYTLYNNNIGVQYIAHRLVAEYFIDNPKGLPAVHHIDDNRANNYYKNLKWITQKENIQAEIANKVRYYNKTTNVYENYPTIDAFTKKSGITSYKFKKIRKNTIPIKKQGLVIWETNDFLIEIYNSNKDERNETKKYLESIMMLSA